MFNVFPAVNLPLRTARHDVKSKLSHQSQAVKVHAHKNNKNSNFFSTSSPSKQRAAT
jgi:hypothetical protein